LDLEILEDRIAPATYVVLGLADGAGVITPSGVPGYFRASTLRAAITAVNASTTGANDTIDLAVPGTYQIALAGTPGETDNAAGEFAIIPTGTNGSSLTIQNTSGGAVTVNGNHLNRVFDINPSNTPTTPKVSVTMSGFTITNGLAAPGDGADGSGGGIRDQNNVSLTLNSMTLLNNSATADGGGVSMENSSSTPWTLTLNNSIVTGNHAGDAGGGVETDGSGAVFVNGGVIGNNTSVNQGAGIWLDAILAQDASMSVGSATVTSGGYYYTAPTVTINDSTGTGATGFAQVVNGQVIGVAITNPGTGYTAPSITINDPTGFGASVTANLNVLQSANLTVTGALISNNKALSLTSGAGGGIGNAGNGAVTIQNSTISSNTAGGVGGGFADENSMGSLMVLKSYFLNNVAFGNGGAIAESGPQTSITNAQFQGNATSGFGGGIFATGITLLVHNSTLAGNVSTDNGAGIEAAPLGTGLAASNIQDTTLTGNVALNGIGGIGNGGGIDAEETGDLALQNDTINTNFASNGGGLFWSGNSGTLAVQNTIIAANVIASDDTGPDVENPNGTINDGGGNLIGVSGAGGGNTGFTAGTTQIGTVATPLNPLLAPLAYYGGPTVGAPGNAVPLQTQALFLGSPAFGKGVLFGAPPTDERGFPSVIHAKINAGAVSGVLAVPAPGAVARAFSQHRYSPNGITVFNVNTTADLAPGNVVPGQLTLRQAIQLANNTAGAVYINMYVPGTYKITLPGTPGETDNQAGEFAIYQGGAVNPTSLTIQNVSGGAITVDGNHLNRVFDINPDQAETSPKFSVTMTGFTITNGVASAGSGGGIRDQGNVNLSLNSMTLADNIATAAGGGIAMENFVSAAWTLTLTNSIVTGNHAGGGGGIDTDGAGKVFVNGGIISNNTSAGPAGISLDSPTADGMGSVTITNPGAGYVAPPTVTFSAPQNPGDTTATGTATLTGDVVTGVTITNPGSGYAFSTPTVTFSPPPAGITATGVANVGVGTSANLTVTGTLVTGNLDLLGFGGGIGNFGNGKVSITGSTLSNNLALYGGAFADQNGEGTLSITGSFIDNNVALLDAGAVAEEGGLTTTINASQFQGNVSGAFGGAVYDNGTTLTVARSTFNANVSALGGASLEVATTGTLALTDASTISNSTISGNVALNNNTGVTGPGALANGGGIDAEETGDLALLNDTINANFADNGGGVLWVGNAGTTLSVQNTIIAANFISNDGTGPDALNSTNTVTDNGGNLIGISGAGSGNTGFTAGTTQSGTVATSLNPLLATLSYDGGPIVGAPGSAIGLQTESELLGSPALFNGVVGIGLPATDERGFPRVVSGKVDVGAFQTPANSSVAGHHS
jgi:hypothetical protein